MERRFAFFVVTFWILGCSLLGRSAVSTVTLPPVPVLPEFWALDDSIWEVWWTDGAVHRTLSTPAAAQSVEIIVPEAGQDTVVVGAHLVNHRLRCAFRPAGCTLFPGESAVLSWRDGPLAMILTALARNGIAPSLVNAERLRRELEVRVPDNPWAVDLARVAQKLADDEMRSTYVVAQTTQPLSLAAPAGVYRSENILLPTVETRLVAGSYRLDLEVVPRQSTAWWHLSEPVEVIVCCSDDGRCQSHVRRLDGAAVTSRRNSPACPVR